MEIVAATLLGFPAGWNIATMTSKIEPFHNKVAAGVFNIVIAFTWVVLIT